MNYLQCVKKIKCLVCLVCLSLLVLSLYGCLFRNPNREALTYMEKKYGEKFSYIGPHGSTNGSKTASILVSCESFPGREILVTYTRLDGGGFEFHDNYMSYFYEADTRSLLKDIATQIYGECKVFYWTAQFALPDSINSSSSLEDYIAADASPIFVTFVLNPNVSIEARDEDANRLCALLTNSKLNVAALIYYASKNSYVLINQDNIHKYENESDWYLSFGTFYVDNGLQELIWR